MISKTFHTYSPKHYSPKQQPSSSRAHSSQKQNPHDAKITTTQHIGNPSHTASPSHLERAIVLRAYAFRNIGDKNQTLGISHFLSKLTKDSPTHVDFSDHDISTDSFSESIQEEIKTKLQNKAYQKIIVLLAGSGQQVANAMDHIPDSNEIILVHTSHQFTDSIRDKKRQPDLMILPQSSLGIEDSHTPTLSNTPIMTVSGVAHNIHPDSLTADTEQYLSTCIQIQPSTIVLNKEGKQKFFNTCLPPINESTIAVILPGDAPDLNETEKEFTQENAIALADRILDNETKSQKSEPSQVIVTNGPRTGKHLAKDRTLSHQTGITDLVTQAFVSRLQEKNIKTILLDFQFPALPSAYKPLLKSFLEADKKGNFYVAGESTSMVSEVGSLLDKVIAVDAESMNSNHQAHINSLLSNGLISYLKLDGSIDAGNTRDDTSKPPLAAESIAHTIIKDFL